MASEAATKGTSAPGYRWLCGKCYATNSGEDRFCARCGTPSHSVACEGRSLGPWLRNVALAAVVAGCVATGFFRMWHAPDQSSMVIDGSAQPWTVTYCWVLGIATALTVFVVGWIMVCLAIIADSTSKLTRS